MADVGSFISKSSSTLVNVRLTNRGRELLTRGLYEQDTFDVVKFAFGDSEVDYRLTDAEIELGIVMRPSAAEVDFVSKLYARGTVPTGNPLIALDISELELSRNQRATVSVTTTWPPVAGRYAENYKWINLGPLEDWEFGILPSNNTRSATIVSYDIVGTTQIKIVGQTTGKYAILDLIVG